MSRIRVMISQGANVRFGGEELLPQAPPAEGWIWVDLQDLDPEREQTILQQTFGIARLAIQDAQRDRHPPKLELFEGHLFLLLRELAADSDADTPNFVHTSVFVASNFIVSRRAFTSPSLDQVFAAMQDGSVEHALGPGHAAYRICRAVVDEYTPLVLELEERLSDLEDEMFAHPSDEILEALSGHNRTLKKLRRTLAYQHGMADRIASDNEQMPFTFDYHEFNDVAENMERLASLCQLNQELVVDLMNTYLSVTSHRLNQIMRVLTIATVIFLPLGLLAGIYGMNFEVIPELKWKYGYFAVIGTMLTVVTTLVVVFRKKDWL